MLYEARPEPIKLALVVSLELSLAPNRTIPIVRATTRSHTYVCFKSWFRRTLRDTFMICSIYNKREGIKSPHPNGSQVDVQKGPSGQGNRLHHYYLAAGVPLPDVALTSCHNKLTTLHLSKLSPLHSGSGALLLLGPVERRHGRRGRGVDLHPPNPPDRPLPATT